jgi:rubrerythrin
MVLIGRSAYDTAHMHSTIPDSAGAGGIVMDPRLMTLIDTAIQREEDAYRFYMDLHAKVKDPAVGETIAWIAGEEQKHRAFLVKYRRGDFGAAGLRLSDVVYYKIAEHQEEPEVKADMNSSEVYLVAAHRELRSHQFYAALSHQHEAGEAREILLTMANEELKHKEKMEYLFANTAFPQTSGG